MLNVIISTPNRKMRFCPDNLPPDFKAHRRKRIIMIKLPGTRRVPLIDDVAGEQYPGFAPIGATIVCNSPGRSRPGPADRPVPPIRIIVHAIGRVGHHQMRRHAVQRPGHIIRARRIAADEPMPPELPDIAAPRHRHGRRLGHLIGIGQPSIAPDQLTQLLLGKAEQRQIKSHARQIGDLDPQQRIVPSGIHRKLVVRNPISLLLRLRPAARRNDRHLS